MASSAVELASAACLHLPSSRAKVCHQCTWIKCTSVFSPFLFPYGAFDVSSTIALYWESKHADSTATTPNCCAHLSYMCLPVSNPCHTTRHTHAHKRKKKEKQKKVCCGSCSKVLFYFIRYLSNILLVLTTCGHEPVSAKLVATLGWHVVDSVSIHLFLLRCHFTSFVSHVWQGFQLTLRCQMLLAEWWWKNVKFVVPLQANLLNKCCTNVAKTVGFTCIMSAKPTGWNFLDRITFTLTRCILLEKFDWRVSECRVVAWKFRHLRIGWATAWHKTSSVETCLKIGHWKRRSALTSSHTKTIHALNMHNTHTKMQRQACLLRGRLNGKESQKWVLRRG